MPSGKRRVAGFTYIGLLLFIAILLHLPPAQAIVAGDPAASPPDTPAQRIDENRSLSAFAGVGEVQVRGGTYSGALISPRHVITAAHVVNGAEPSQVVFVLNAGGNASHTLAAKKITVYPGYKGFHPGPDGIVRDDLAIIELATPAPDTVPVYAPFFGLLPPGIPLTFVGYGATGDGINGVTGGASHVKRVGANAADVLLPDPADATLLKVFLFDFDAPDGSRGPMGGPSLGNRVETTCAGGDSGCPALLMVDGVWRLVGVGTFVIQGALRAGQFGTGGGGMLVEGYQKWVVETLGVGSP